MNAAVSDKEKEDAIAQSASIHNDCARTAVPAYGPPPSNLCAVRRHRSYRAGRGLELLGHAIGYLIDEDRIERRSNPVSYRSRAEAIEILIALNRQIHLACPPVPTIRERLATLRWPLQTILDFFLDTREIRPENSRAKQTSV